MRILSKKLSRIEGCIYGLISVHYRPTRSLRISRPNGLDERAVSTRRVTKKKYSDLPKVQLLPDGQSAMPLPDWEGGLPPGAVRKRSARLSTGRAPIRNEFLIPLPHYDRRCGLVQLQMMTHGMRLPLLRKISQRVESDAFGRLLHPRLLMVRASKTLP
jgi:hypothetical protein